MDQETNHVKGPDDSVGMTLFSMFSSIPCMFVYEDISVQLFRTAMPLPFDIHNNFTQTDEIGEMVVDSQYGLHHRAVIKLLAKYCA